ncbi:MULTISPECIES: hypothetical protein [unclassified Acinetobacter]|uniref:hypothetical protein n=1 Tax=unclassified Acinetobacter TaxID=196816 RepID=UPI0029347F36|nr:MULTISPECIES: hypothetical protein [unclassified Acinetobacter]WOE30606.1 hypothetical protein QSG84_09415 [Acinetobacter sp. SAAs470]WOE38798.1 hypothetical protein QSG86_03080 [Acinetobacter sp. SAAs474]
MKFISALFFVIASSTSFAAISSQQFTESTQLNRTEKQHQFYNDVKTSDSDWADQNNG